MKKFLCVFLALFTLTLTGCGGKEVYRGDGYEFSYNAKKWELGFEDEDDIFFNYKGFAFTNFNVFRYTTKESVSLNERLERSKEFCETNDYTWVSGEILSNGGMEWGREEYQMESQGFVIKYVDFFTYSGMYTYSIFFSSDADNFDECIKDFEEVFYSFKITK